MPQSYADGMLAPGSADLATLDLLVSVAELGSLGRAAARHGLTQPAVSMRMSSLERRLGLRLLERHPSGTRLTRAGERVVVASRVVVAEAAVLASVVEGLKADLRSQLRVAASLTVAEYLLPAWVQAVHRERPDVSLTLEVVNSSRVLAAVAAGRVDIGFIEGVERELPGAATVTVSADRLVVVVHARHPWARRADALDGSELAGTDLIVRERGSGTREVLDAVLAPWGGVRSRLELGSTSALISAACRGEGPAVLSELAVLDHLLAGRLVCVPTVGIDLTRLLRAVWMRSAGLAPLARTLLGVAGVNEREVASSTRPPTARARDRAPEP